MKFEIKIVDTLIEFIFWVPIIFFSAILSYNTFAYFTFGNSIGILPEKNDALKDDLWILFFYLHLLSGILSLVSPIIVFIGRHFGLPHYFHQKIGKLYVLNTLILLVPTGIYLGTYAKGGWIAQVGFIFQGVLQFYFTFLGFASARKNDVKNHIYYMIKSYAVVTSALTFRVLHILFISLNLPYHLNYSISQWLSLTLNLGFAEFIILYIMISKKVQLINSKT